MAAARTFRRSFSRVLAATTLAGSLVVLQEAVAHATPIACGAVVSATKVLSEDVRCPAGWTGDAILVTGTGVTLDLNGHAIVGRGVGGVRIRGTNNSVVNNATRAAAVTGFAEASCSTRRRPRRSTV